MKLINLISVLCPLVFSNLAYSQCLSSGGVGGGDFQALFPIGGLMNGDCIDIEASDVVTVSFTDDYSSISNLTINVLGVGGDLTINFFGYLILGTGSTVNVESGATLNGPGWIGFGPFFSAQNPLIAGNGFVPGRDPNPTNGPSTISETGPPLPITLVYFNASVELDNVILSWATSYEENFSHFEIEKSSNGLDFIRIEDVQSKGGLEKFTEYSFTDVLPFSDLNYYRLKAVDYDGSFEYSDIVSISGDGSGPRVKVFPNPVSDRFVLNMNFVPGNPGVLKLYDFTGNVVFQTSVEDFKSEIYIPEHIRKGTYILSSRFKEIRTTTRIIVE